MFRPRIIPVLLLQGGRLVKSVRFKNHKYIGDPINAVRIFNEFKADELIFLDINASKTRSTIDIGTVKKIGEEADMPFGVGGGINSLSQIKNLISAGAEKVVISTAAVRDPDFIKAAADEFGSSTISVCIDVKKSLWGKKKVFSNNGSKNSGYSPMQFAQMVQEKGAGEIILQSVDRDGTMNGYDFLLLQEIACNITIPVVALGGAGSLADLKTAYQNCHVNAMAAGSIFVYLNHQKGVLINYPDLNGENL